jgi:hypothetical protein
MIDFNHLLATEIFEKCLQWGGTVQGLQGNGFQRTGCLDQSDCIVDLYHLARDGVAVVKGGIICDRLFAIRIEVFPHGVGCEAEHRYMDAVDQYYPVGGTISHRVLCVYLHHRDFSLRGVANNRFVRDISLI